MSDPHFSQVRGKGVMLKRDNRKKNWLNMNGAHKRKLDDNDHAHKQFEISCIIIIMQCLQYLW